ncbi:hypothetical protein HMPREF3185_01648 [Porphyromonas somerae]|uniref:Uncharacterized protein n=1 Tax=Porphyromonas somerae TaxID=322095 RepID=A0A134B3Z2_9PORP|nr:hypothetical protein HMPREF3184_01648 [Porphyromonadaceae bacterium KA00676]KXB74655.1 hypothetical protein HMPREF3185_01648 [Porphyromonas somerae]
MGAGDFLRWVTFFAYLWSVELCRWRSCPKERQAKAPSWIMMNLIH